MEADNSSKQELLTKTSYSHIEIVEATIPHECRRGKGRHQWLQLLSEWYLLLAYLLVSLSFTAGMVYWLNGKSFAVSGTPGRPDEPFRISQSDVVTIISACLVTGRVIAAAWQVLAAWRCVFILFEKTGLSLNEASCISSWRLPALSIMCKRSKNGGISKPIAVLILLLAWPAQLSSPIASGSVSWVPSTEYYNASTTISLATPVAGYQWDWFNRYPDNRRTVVRRSAGRASLVAPASDNGTLPVTSARRMAVHLGSYPNGTVIKNATVPVFIIDSFKWITDPSSIPEGILGAVNNSKSGYLNISQPEGPLTQIVPGTSALLKSTQWRPQAAGALPEPGVRSGNTTYAAINVSRENNGGQGFKYNCTGGDVFDIPPSVYLINNAWNNNHSDCLAVAELEIRAGVTDNIQAEGSSLPPLCVLASSIIISNSTNVMADPLVNLVFDLMPEVQALVAALELHANKTTNGMEALLRDSLTQAYQGTWTALAEYFGERPQDLTSEIWEPVNLLEARVSTQRMLLWLGLSMLLVLSGILLAAIQTTSKGKTVNNPAVAAIMLDSSEVTRADSTGLCNAVDTGKGHGDAKMRLRLEVSTGSTMLGGYRHPRLVPEKMR